MPEPLVLEVPQWQGSSSATARRLPAGAKALADLLPFGRRLTPRTDASQGSGRTTRGVRAPDALAANLAAVRAALDEADAPLVVTAGGDCGVELAPVERAHRLHGERLAVVWFDAHADLNTASSSPSEAFHGMVLRALLGEGPEALRCRWPLSPGQVVLAGARALDPAERRYIAAHGVRHLRVAELADPRGLVEAVAATGAEAVYVHLDLDVLDPGAFSSVGVPEPDGLTPHRLAAAVRALAARFPLAGLGVTEHEPAEDGAARAADAAVLDQLVRALADTVSECAREDVRRIERHALEAWPAPVRRTSGGWLLRHTPGMRRLRSGNTALPLPPATGSATRGAAAHASTLHEVEAFYAARGLPAAVQVSPAARHMALDEHLAALGYTLGEPIHVLTAPAEAVADAPPGSAVHASPGSPVHAPPGNGGRAPAQDAVEAVHAVGAPGAADGGSGWRLRVDEALSPQWLEAFTDLDGHEDSRDLAEQVVSRISSPVACVSALGADRRPVGLGLFVGGDERWAGVYCMVTHPRARRQGVAAAVLRAGALWASRRRIRGLYLQVARSNPAARALYARAGFGYAYSYHYRLRGVSHGGSVTEMPGARVTVR
ncbi:GNAT family N-acetyltransferase [Streptomyces tubbatahanensis]|uniref:GNAT family N-acetyltransferase n=1 Tax=Streptomyces tubbatahanensis TaxID=2923272 RepID=A0ABY3XRS9_9ACTN|nr:GNAT family N-acetyltransferase [Streptomyces tubbatahanensis]UNS96923.1 GNAT family N-acetyltransferase [Streptomyces tubbatahanensis]